MRGEINSIIEEAIRGGKLSTTIEVHKQSVKQLLESGKNPFIIPEYQRPYAWTDEQVVTLFDDLWDFVSNESQKTYFLGSIVSYKNEQNEREIIDGQQRITSLFLLPEKWEIEHIFPQKWQTNYFVNLSDDVIKEKIEHIGNKIPFEKKLNIVAGNGYF